MQDPRRAVDVVVAVEVVGFGVEVEVHDGLCSIDMMSV